MIQAIDIKTKSFKRGIFGYKTSDVDDFKDSLYKEFDEMSTENAKLKKDLERLNASLQENRLKMFDMENQLNQVENVSTYDDSDAKAKADKIIKNAEAAAADIIAKAKAEAKKFEGQSAPKTEASVAEPVKEEPVKPAEEKESASSRFFKKAAEEAPASGIFDDDDEVFVGEIEDARKPERMMIGDGEEEEEMDFEFL